MTPVLQQLLKLPATTSLVKIEQREGVQKLQEIYYVTEKVSPTEEVWEHEEMVEEHAEVLYEDEVAPLGKTMVSLSEVDVLRTTEKPTQRDKKSELRSEISVTDTSKRKETRVTKRRVAPKTQETIVVVQESESDKDRVVTTLQDKPRKEKTEEEFFVRAIESPTEEITDERKDSTLVRYVPEKDLSKQETSVPVKKGKEIIIKTESRERRRIERTEEPTSTKEIELVKDIPLVTEGDKTKTSPIKISTESKKQTERFKIEGKALTEVTYEELADHDVKIISATPEEKYSRTEEIRAITIERTEVTVEDKPIKVTPTQVKRVDEESRKDETRIKPPVISDSKKDTSAPGQVSVKKHELAEKKQEKKPKSTEIIDTKKEKVAEKPKPEVEVTPKVKPKESVTDMELKKPELIKSDIEFESVTEKTEAEYKKKEESKDVTPQSVDTEKTKEDTKPSIPSKPERKRISPQTAARGTERKSNIIMFIFNFFICLHVWVQSLFFFI